MLAVCIVFWAVTQNELIAWSTDFAVDQKPRDVSSLDFRPASTEGRMALDYKPAAWLTGAALSRFAGAHARPYHAVNLFLHCLNAAMLFLLIPKLLRLWAGEKWNLAHYRATYIAAAISTLFWALHPLRVESVAWVAGLSYGQALFFTLLSFYLYIHPFVSRDSAARARVLYWISFGCFVVGVLSSPIVLMYPILLPLIETYVPKAGVGRTGLLQPEEPKWLPHVPFVLVSISFVGIALASRFFQSGDAWSRIFSFGQFGPIERIMQAFYVWGHYLWKVWWPQPLSPLYTTLISFNPVAPVFLVSAAGIGLGTSVLFRSRKRWPGLWRLWVAYLILLAPVLGLAEHPHFPFDRYSLFAGLLWSWLLAGILYRLCLKVNLRVLACGLSALMLCGLGGWSARQIAVWQNSATLFTHTLKTIPPSSPYYSNVAITCAQKLAQAGKYPEAIELMEELLAFERKTAAAAHHIIAGWHFDSGNTARAKFHYREAVRLDPSDASFYNDLGVLLVASGERVLAHDFFQQAVMRDPRYAEAHHNLALLLKEEGRGAEAQVFFAKAQELRGRKL
jgi:hypothetical protein